MGHILAAAAICLAIHPAIAELPPGVEWLNPPEAEAAQPAESFIIFTRSTERPDAKEPTAHIWEIDPQAKTVMPRVRFRHSSWAPRPFSTAEGFPRPGLVSLHIYDPDRRPGNRVDLFDIDFTTWQVRRIHQGPNARFLFWHDETVYIDASDRRAPTAAGLRRLGAGEYTLKAPNEPFQFVRTLRQPSDLQLVQRPDAPPDQFAIYNPANGSVTDIGTLPPDIYNLRTSEIVLTEDLKHIAYHNFENSFQINAQDLSWQITTSHIVLLDRESGEHEWIEFPLWVRPGSGFAYIISHPSIHFTDAGKLRYRVSGRPDREGPTPFEIFEHDPETNSTAQIPTDDLEIAHTLSSRRSLSMPVPERLRPILGDRAANRDIAHAFLELHEIEFERPASALDSTVTFSTDNNRFILKMRNSGRDDTFFYADIEADTLTEIPAPPELRRERLTIIHHRPARP
ncbi:MAG: hypothetical protein JJU33_02310 [Phycisphaerales bacterium]|nr:hypothetical protein [Phycisphaerales bacterium]